MKREQIFFFVILVSLFFFQGCEKEDPEIVPKNGTWEWKSTGTYEDEIDFYILNGKITQPIGDVLIRSIRYKMDFDSWSTTSIYYGTEIKIQNGAFKYVDGTLYNGKTLITGKFISPTTCEGKVTYEEDSPTRKANGYFEYTAVWVSEQAKLSY